jgi:hypothetical protein
MEKVWIVYDGRAADRITVAKFVSDCIKDGATVEHVTRQQSADGLIEYLKARGDAK